MSRGELHRREFHFRKKSKLTYLTCTGEEKTLPCTGEDLTCTGEKKTPLYREGKNSYRGEKNTPLHRGGSHIHRGGKTLTCTGENTESELVEDIGGVDQLLH